MEAVEKIKAAESARQPRPGELWKDGDPREERYVRVLATYPHYVQTIRVKADGSDYPKARITESAYNRFRGGRGGYHFVRALTQEHQ